jgi:hypothetical protein
LKFFFLFEFLFVMFFSLSRHFLFYVPIKFNRFHAAGMKLTIIWSDNELSLLLKLNHNWIKCVNCNSKCIDDDMTASKSLQWRLSAWMKLKFCNLKLIFSTFLFSFQIIFSGDIIQENIKNLSRIFQEQLK